MKKRILICGYPKSGNTWLTRLTAELVGCPVAGNWLVPQTEEQAVAEGEERESDFQCFKSHYSYFNLKKYSRDYENGTEKLIYIVRDPRDVVVSAANYFDFRPFHPKLNSILGMIPAGLRLYYKLFERDPDLKQNQMTSFLLKGTKIFMSLSTPWKEHVLSYQNSEALFLKYEDLLTNPIQQLKKICGFLEIERDESQIKAAIQKQSFENKKKELAENGRTNDLKLMRSGKAGSWKNELNKNNTNRINVELVEVLKQYGYL